MTRQEIFDTVVAHLLTQRARAYDESINACAYRSPDGRKCAIGCLIPDELYVPGLEGWGALQIANPTCNDSSYETPEDETVNALLAIRAHLGISSTDTRFLAHLQHIHDNVDIEDWERTLRAAANEFELVWNWTGATP